MNNHTTTTPQGITVLHQSATLGGFEDQGTPARPLSQPPSRLTGIDVALPGAEGHGTGLWQCEPGSFERQLAQAAVQLGCPSCGRKNRVPDESTRWRCSSDEVRRHQRALRQHLGPGAEEPA
ncbi:MAG: hypothetical protein ACK4PH_01665 [Aquincola tertiaricarbonis]